MARQLEPFDRLWRNWTLGLIAAFVLAMGIAGFVILPIIQGGSAGLNPLTSIARSVGIEPGSPAARQPVSVVKAQPVSSVAWTPQVIDRLRHPDRSRGAAIAASACASCHGQTEISSDPQFPHMAGQSAYAIYKELHDFKNGARSNEIMASIVQSLDDAQMADVAAHYAAVTKGARDPRVESSDDPELLRLVEYGYTDRALPACASCHGAHAGGPVETPTITGQREVYLAQQLKAFASGERRNDIYARMRAVAAKLRPDEIEKLARFYGGRRLMQSKD